METVLCEHEHHKLGNAQTALWYVMTSGPKAESFYGIDKYCSVNKDIVGCNYLGMPEIASSGTQILPWLMIYIRHIFSTGHVTLLIFPETNTHVVI